MTVDSASGAERWKPIEQWIALGSFITVTLLICVFLLRDVSGLVNSPQDELIAHVGASAGFTVAAAGSLIILRRDRPSLLLVLVAGAAVTAMAELAQGLVPDRVVELRDLVSGFAGVLLTGICIELILRTFSLFRAMRVHLAAASLAATALAVILLLQSTPETILAVAPNGESCPLTQILGSGERIIVGTDLRASNGCVRTDVGGFGLVGPDDADALDPETVLVSSEMKGLALAFANGKRILLRAEITTDAVFEDSPLTGMLAILASDDFGQLLQVRTRKRRIEVIGPAWPDPFRASIFALGLEENEHHLIEIELAGGTLTVRVDGESAGTTRVNPDWIEALEEDDLRLFIGNSPARTLPFHGVIEWIELDS